MHNSLLDTMAPFYLSMQPCGASLVTTEYFTRRILHAIPSKIFDELLLHPNDFLNRLPSLVQNRRVRQSIMGWLL